MSPPTSAPARGASDASHRDTATPGGETAPARERLARVGDGGRDAVHAMAEAAAAMRRANGGPPAPRRTRRGAEPARDAPGTAPEAATERAERAGRSAPGADPRRVQMRLRALCEAIPHLVWISRAQGHWEWVGPQWRAYTGLGATESLGHGWYEAVHPEDRAGVRAAWHEAGARGTGAGCEGEAALRAGGDVLDVECRLRRAGDGAWRWFRTRAVRLPARGAGEPRWFGTCTDVDDLKRAEAALLGLNAALEAEVARRTRERDRTWRLSQELLAVARLDGVLVAVNPAWTRLLGHAEAELVGRSVLDLVHPDDRAALVAERDRLAGAGGISRLENRYRHRDGSWRRIAWAAVPDEGLVYATGRDVTAEREAAAELQAAEASLRQAQKMEAVGQLTGGIAHDFNNMLQGVGGALELLHARWQRGQTQEAGRYLDMARTGVERAAALTHGLLAFARRQTLRPRPVDTDALIAGMAELVRRTAGPGIAVELRLGDGIRPVLCDPNGLESALLNLCINARDAMSSGETSSRPCGPLGPTSDGPLGPTPGGGTLTLSTAHARLGPAEIAGQEGARPGEYVAVSVSDTGAGMPPDVLARALEPFFTTKPVGQGTGLGLSQVYGFVRQSGGVMRLDSAPGRGTVVCLYLPRHEGAPPDAGPGAPDPARAGPEGGHGGGGVVLLVEDDDAVRELAAERLGELGYAVLQAADGPAGLRVLRSAARVDLLVTDVGLPGLNGRQLAEAAREDRPGLPVLLVTGHAGEAADGALPAGVDVLGKPFALDELAGRVEALLAGRPPSRA